jgi:hypothetical protein
VVQHEVPPPVSRRVKALLVAVRVPIEEWMVAVVGKTLEDTEQQFFRNAEQSRSNVDQQRWFDALGEVRRGRPDIAPRFLVSFEAILMRPPTREVPRVREALAAADLGLVHEDEFEAGLILEDGASRAEVRMHEALYALSHRFAVIWECPPLAVPDVPVGPRAINQAFAGAISHLRLEPAAKQILLRAYDRLALQGIGELLESINALFVRQGVLANFGGYSARRPEAGSAATAAAEEKPTPEDAPAKESKSEKPADQQQVNANASLAQAPAQMDPPTPPDQDQFTWTAADQSRFADLLAALASMRRPASQDMPPRPGAHAVAVGAEDLQTVLAHLQTMPNQAQLVAGRRLPRNIGHVRQSMLEHVARSLPAGSQPVLRQQDEDVLDLMEAFLGSLQHEMPGGRVIEQVLTRLQVPLVRLALDDQTFFTRSDHPARQLLGAIADVSQSCFEDDPDGRRMLERLGAIGDRISAEYQQGVSLFQQLFGDLTTHMRSVQRRAEAAERRQVEAARGRERLALARRTADSALADRIAARAPDELLRSTLEHAWADVLALTLLRHGPESEVYRQRLLVVERLLVMREKGAATPDEAKAVREEIENGLALVGYHLSEARHVMQKLLGGSGGDEDPAASAELAKRLRARTRLGEQQIGGSAGAEPSTPVQQAWIERVQSLPIGTWLAPGNGEGPHQKIAWRSDELGRVLLVNRRATSSEERSIADLAADLERGVLRSVAPQSVPPVERVFQRILAKSASGPEDTFHA